MQVQDGKVKRKNSKCPFLTKNCWETMQNQLNSSGMFSKDSRRCRFFRKSRMICESGTLNLKNSQTGSSACQCSTTSNGQESERWNLYFQPRKTKVSGSWRRQEVVWNSSIQYSKCFESWNSEKEEWQKHHTLRCGCFAHRTLVPNHSLCKSIHGTVTNWCEHFGLTEEEKVQEKQKESVTKKFTDMCEITRSNIQDFDSLTETIRFTCIARAPGINWYELQNQT